MHNRRKMAQHCYRRGYQLVAIVTKKVGICLRMNRRKPIALGLAVEDKTILIHPDGSIHSRTVKTEWR